MRSIKFKINCSTTSPVQGTAHQFIRPQIQVVSVAVSKFLISVLLSTPVFWDMMPYRSENCNNLHGVISQPTGIFVSIWF